MNRFLITVSAFCFLSGCSFIKPRGSTTLASTDVKGTEETSEAPLRLDILEESNDGHTLSVRGRVVPRASLPLSEIGVRLQAIDGSGSTREAMWNAGEGSVGGTDVAGGAPMARKDIELPFLLSLPVEDISDYQVELLWGSEARSVVRKPTTSGGGGPAFVALRNLRVQRVTDPHCSSDPCLVSFQVMGEIFNSGNNIVTSLDIGAGVLARPEGGGLDLDQDIPENERTITVKNLHIEPGGVKPLRLAFDEFFDPEVAQYMRPALRIISVNVS